MFFGGIGLWRIACRKTFREFEGIFSGQVGVVRFRKTRNWMLVRIQMARRWEFKSRIFAARRTLETECHLWAGPTLPTVIPRERGVYRNGSSWCVQLSTVAPSISDVSRVTPRNGVLRRTGFQWSTADAPWTSVLSSIDELGP